MANCCPYRATGKLSFHDNVLEKKERGISIAGCGRFLQHEREGGARPPQKSSPCFFLWSGKKGRAILSWNETDSFTRTRRCRLGLVTGKEKEPESRRSPQLPVQRTSDGRGGASPPRPPEEKKKGKEQVTPENCPLVLPRKGRKERPSACMLTKKKKSAALPLAGKLPTRPSEGKRRRT